MAKYIDADHLKVEIEKHIKEVKDAAKRFTPNIGFFDAKLSGIYDVIAIIDSLQQKQPEKPMNQEGLEKEIERWDSDNADDNGFYNRIDFARHFYDLGCRRTAEKYDEIEYNRQRAEESEKPMNLEEEINRYLHEECSDDDEPSVSDIARHFAKWGAEHFRDTTKKIEPPCHTVEEWIEHIKNADQLTKDIFSMGPYDVLYDALNRPYRDCYDAIKEFGELCYQTARQDMMEEAVEGEVCIPNVWVEHKEGKELVVRAEISKELGFKFGDKVRIIVCKNED